jgi:hypothetical protein
MLVEEILQEANVEPLGLKRLDQFLDDLYKDLDEMMQHLMHEGFLKRLRKDIINQNIGMGMDPNYMALYAPKDSDPSYLKKGDVYTIYNSEKDIPKDILKRVKDTAAVHSTRDSANPDDWPEETPPEELSPAHANTTEELKKFIHKELIAANYVSGDDRGTFETDNPGGLYKIFQKAYMNRRPDDKEYNEIEPFIRKYEAGKYNLEGIMRETRKILSQGPLWQRDPEERERLEKEAPIIMRFDNGFKWVRLDSKQEFEHESAMLGNCLHGYCPAQETPTGTGSGGSAKAIYQAWKDAGKPGDKEANEDKKGTANYWFWDKREEAGVTEPITPNLRSLMKWVEKTKEKLYPDVVAMEPDWFEDDLPRGWKHGVDMEGRTFGKYLDTDHYYAAFIVEYEYFARNPADPDHNPDDWDFNEVPEELDGHLVYSLRDKQGESHAAIEYDPRNPEPEQLELKGKQNKDVSKKYMKYVDALNKHWQGHPEDFGSKIKKNETLDRVKYLAGIRNVN